MDKINLFKPSITEREIAAVERVLRSGWLTFGEETGKLEREFADFVGAKYAVAVNSATAGLHLAVKILNEKLKKKNGNIVVPAITFISTALAGMYEGLEVRVADVMGNGNINLLHAQRLCDENTVAILPVRYGGAGIQNAFWDVPIIADNAHAADRGSHYGTMSVYSFHPVKNIATGDMGIVTTNSEEVRDLLKLYRWCGINKSTHEREVAGYNWDYEIPVVGHKYNPNDIFSALARVQLSRQGELKNKRVEVARRYDRGLEGLPVRINTDVNGSLHLYTIKVEKRDALLKHLKENGISAGVHYKPLYYHPVIKWKSGYTNYYANEFFNSVLSLPFYPDLTEEDQDRVLTAIKEFYA